MLPPPPVFNPEDLIGTFLVDKQEDGQVFRGRIVELIEDVVNNESKVEDKPTSMLMMNSRRRLLRTTKCWSIYLRTKRQTSCGNFNVSYPVKVHAGRKP
jgi:hypothetical protein